MEDTWTVGTGVAAFSCEGALQTGCWYVYVRDLQDYYMKAWQLLKAAGLSSLPNLLFRVYLICVLRFGLFAGDDNRHKYSGNQSQHSHDSEGAEPAAILLLCQSGHVCSLGATKDSVY